MRWHRLALAVMTVLIPAGAPAQEYKIEPFQGAPPEALAAPIREALDDHGYRVVDDQGKAFVEIWPRKVVPAASKPAGPEGAVQFPFLAVGELLVALRYTDEGHDYRDQTIAPGGYTLRYGLQPVNGDHLGVSTYRDYALLLPPARDKAVPAVPQKPLEERSAEAAGTSHPAVLMMLTAPAPDAAEPSLVHDEMNNLWGAVVPLNLEVKGGGKRTFAVQIIVVGAAMN